VGYTQWIGKDGAESYFESGAFSWMMRFVRVLFHQQQQYRRQPISCVRQNLLVRDNGVSFRGPKWTIGQRTSTVVCASEAAFQHTIGALMR
jgi:hypothetical protein